MLHVLRHGFGNIMNYGTRELCIITGRRYAYRLRAVARKSSYRVFTRSSKHRAASSTFYRN